MKFPNRLGRKSRSNPLVMFITSEGAMKFLRAAVDPQVEIFAAGGIVLELEEAVAAIHHDNDILPPFHSRVVAEEISVDYIFPVQRDSEVLTVVFVQPFPGGCLALI